MCRALTPRTWLIERDHAGDRILDIMMREAYELEFSDDFDGDDLDTTRWLPAHLPQWSSRSQAAARYHVLDGLLVLRIDERQQPWCPEFDGSTKVSSLQTGVFSGPLSSSVGQHRFNERAVVREAQQPMRLYTPRFGYFEVRARAVPEPDNMVAFWMIGYEDAPERSGEICICEVFGRDVEADSVHVGMGVHPFRDPHLLDDFERVRLEMDATAFHVYAAEWTPTHVNFYVDGGLVKTVDQSPQYPMQFMLGVYEFEPRDAAGTVGRRLPAYPKQFVVDYVRGYRRQGDVTGGDVPVGRVMDLPAGTA